MLLPDFGTLITAIPLAYGRAAASLYGQRQPTQSCLEQRLLEPVEFPALYPGEECAPFTGRKYEKRYLSSLTVSYGQISVRQRSDLYTVARLRIRTLAPFER